MNSSKGGRRDTISQMTHDVIGKPLKLFFRNKQHNSHIEIPEVFIKIYEYFMIDQSRFFVKDLFKKQVTQ